MTIKHKFIYVSSDGIFKTNGDYNTVEDISSNYRHAISSAVSQFSTNKGYVVVTSVSDDDYYVTCYQVTPSISDSTVATFERKLTSRTVDHIDGEWGKLTPHYREGHEVLVIPCKTGSHAIEVAIISLPPNDYRLDRLPILNLPSIDLAGEPQAVSYKSQLYILFRNTSGKLYVYTFNESTNTWNSVPFPDQYTLLNFNVFVYQGWIYIFLRKGNSNKFLRTDFNLLDESHSFYEEQEDFSVSSSEHKGQRRLFYYQRQNSPTKYQDFTFDGEKAVYRTGRDIYYYLHNFNLIDLTVLGIGNRLIIPMIISGVE